MSTQVDLKQNLEVCRSLGDIIDVIKTAALFQFRIFQSKKNSPREEFAEVANTCFKIFNAKQFSHPYLFDRETMPSAVLAVTSDEGFLGEMNTALVNTAADLLKDPKDELIVLGERGGKYFEDMDLKFTLFPGISEDVEFSEVARIRDYLLEGFKKRFGRVFVVYPRFVSLVLQRVEYVNLLPVKIEGGLPAHVSARLLEDLEIDPSPRSFLEELVKLYVGYRLVSLFWSSKQSEYGARIMHLEGSTQELQHQKQKLTFDHVRLMHSLKDKSIREISASKIILDKKR